MRPSRACHTINAKARNPNPSPLLLPFWHSLASSIISVVFTPYRACHFTSHDDLLTTFPLSPSQILQLIHGLRRRPQPQKGTVHSCSNFVFGSVSRSTSTARRIPAKLSRSSSQFSIAPLDLAVSRRPAFNSQQFNDTTIYWKQTSLSARQSLCDRAAGVFVLHLPSFTPGVALSFAIDSATTGSITSFHVTVRSGRTSLGHNAKQTPKSKRFYSRRHPRPVAFTRRTFFSSSVSISP